MDSSMPLEITISVVAFWLFLRWRCTNLWKSLLSFWDDCIIFSAMCISHWCSCSSLCTTQQFSCLIHLSFLENVSLVVFPLVEGKFWVLGCITYFFIRYTFSNWLDWCLRSVIWHRCLPCFMPYVGELINIICCVLQISSVYTCNQISDGGLIFLFVTFWPIWFFDDELGLILCLSIFQNNWYSECN